MMCEEKLIKQLPTEPNDFFLAHFSLTSSRGVGDTKIIRSMLRSYSFRIDLVWQSITIKYTVNIVLVSVSKRIFPIVPKPAPKSIWRDDISAKNHGFLFYDTRGDPDFTGDRKIDSDFVQRPASTSPRSCGVFLRWAVPDINLALIQFFLDSKQS